MATEYLNSYTFHDATPFCQILDGRDKGPWRWGALVVIQSNHWSQQLELGHWPSQGWGAIQRPSKRRYLPLHMQRLLALILGLSWHVGMQDHKNKSSLLLRAKSLETLPENGKSISLINIGMAFHMKNSVHTVKPRLSAPMRASFSSRHEEVDLNWCNFFYFFVWKILRCRNPT